MKTINLIITLLFVGIFTSQAQQSPPTADEVLKEAKLKAATENKNVMIIFTASWCGWCKRMDKSIEDDACKDFFKDHYVIRHLVVDESKDKVQLENPGARELRAKHYGEGQGIPFWLVFDKDGNLLADSKIRKEGEGPDKGDNAGCPASEKEVAYFISVLQQTSPITAAEVEAIRKRFRENDK